MKHYAAESTLTGDASKAGIGRDFFKSVDQPEVPPLKVSDGRDKSINDRDVNPTGRRKESATQRNDIPQGVLSSTATTEPDRTYGSTKSTHSFFKTRRYDAGRTSRYDASLSAGISSRAITA